MMDDAWDKLIGLAGDLIRSPNPHATLSLLEPERLLFELYLPDVEAEMFLAAANRLADRMGLALLRIDVEDGKPNLILCFGSNLQEARQTGIRYYEDMEVMFD